MRKAASMIELVVAIIVMSIVLMSLPLLISQTNNNNEFAMQQEAILAARTKLGDILTYPWDETIANSTAVALVLDTNDTGSDNELDKNTTSRRIGHVLGDKRRKGYDVFTPSTSNAALGTDAGEIAVETYDDIDDFSGTSQTLLASAASTTDYKFGDMNITTTVFYVNDTANYSDQNITGLTLSTLNVNRRSNIKMVQVDVNVTGTQNKFTLRSYSCNIGESELLRRTW